VPDPADDEPDEELDLLAEAEEEEFENEPELLPDEDELVPDPPDELEEDEVLPSVSGVSDVLCESTTPRLPPGLVFDVICEFAATCLPRSISETSWKDEDGSLFDAEGVLPSL
jgi:hypothetical protein